MTRLTDPQAASLYEDHARVKQRSASLKAAKISGESPIDTVIELIGTHAPAHPALLEVGPGRGSLLRRLADTSVPCRLAAVDRSQAMLDEIGRRVGEAERRLADFHELPWPDASFDVVVAAFVLYHSATPDLACREVLRVTCPGGVLIAVTKSADSYQALDELIAAAGIESDCDAPLYVSFCSENAEGRLLDAGALTLERVDQKHHFRFEDPGSAALYAVTVPKYRCHGASAAAVAAQLAAVWPSGGLEMSSTVTYVAATRR